MGAWLEGGRRVGGWILVGEGVVGGLLCGALLGYYLMNLIAGGLLLSESVLKSITFQILITSSPP